MNEYPVPPAPVYMENMPDLLEALTRLKTLITNEAYATPLTEILHYLTYRLMYQQYETFQTLETMKEAQLLANEKILLITAVLITTFIIWALAGLIKFIYYSYIQPWLEPCC